MCYITCDKVYVRVEIVHIDKSMLLIKLSFAYQFKFIHIQKSDTLYIHTVYSFKINK